jgi:hypothetical protein
MSLESIITVQIDRTSTTVSQTGFGQPMIVGYFPTSIFPQRSKEYSSLTEMVTDGFLSTDPLYLCASDCWAQNPSPPTIKIGRRLGAPQQVVNIAPDAPVAGDVHVVTVIGYADSSFATRALPATADTHELTIAAESDAEDIVDAFVTAFATPASDWSVTKTGTGVSAVLVVTADNSTMDGLIFGVTYSVNDGSRGVDNLTLDPTIKIETDLGDIEAYDPDWYGLCMDSDGRDEIWDEAAQSGAANWVESNNKLFVCQTADILVTSDAGEETSVAYELKEANFDRTMLFAHRNNRDRVSAAMLGRALPEAAGSITWAMKELNAVSSQDFSTSEINIANDKAANVITTIAGVAVTRFGTASGGEYMDVMRGADWLSARIAERIYGALISNDKIPYTDAGISVIKNEILAQLDAGVARDFLAPIPEPTCTVPRAADVSAALKGARSLEDVTFRAVLAGAVHKVAIEGQLTL